MSRRGRGRFTHQSEDVEAQREGQVETEKETQSDEEFFPEGCSSEENCCDCAEDEGCEDCTEFSEEESEDCEDCPDEEFSKTPNLVLRNRVVERRPLPRRVHQKERKRAPNYSKLYCLGITPFALLGLLVSLSMETQGNPLELDTVSSAQAVKGVLTGIITGLTWPALPLSLPFSLWSFGTLKLE